MKYSPVLEQPHEGVLFGVDLGLAEVGRPALERAEVGRPALELAEVGRPALDLAGVGRPELAGFGRPALAGVDHPALVEPEIIRYFFKSFAYKPIHEILAGTGAAAAARGRPLLLWVLCSRSE